jgi:hypothetical protein
VQDQRIELARFQVAHQCCDPGGRIGARPGAGLFVFIFGPADFDGRLGTALRKQVHDFFELDAGEMIGITSEATFDFRSQGLSPSNEVQKGVVSKWRFSS